MQRTKELEERVASKEVVLARRRDEIENERQVKRLYAEQIRLRHEERLAACQLASLQSSMRTQRELFQRQQKAQDEREHRKAAIKSGRYVAQPEDKLVRSDTAPDGAERPGAGGRGTAAERLARAQERYDERRQQAAAAERAREEKATMAREVARRRQERERQEKAARREEQDARRQQAMASARMAEEARRLKIESASELAARRSEEARERVAAERERKRREAELREEGHRENAERVRRAQQHKLAQTTASIASKNQRYEERRQEAAETQQARVAFELERQRQEASLARKLRAKATVELAAARQPHAGSGHGKDDGVASEPTTAVPLDGAAASAIASREPPRRRRAPDVPIEADVSRGGQVGAAAVGAAADIRTGEAGRGYETRSVTDTRTNDEVREAQRHRAAFAAIERLRAEQNAELRAAVEAEREREADRVKLLSVTPEGTDRARLQKLLKLERDRADAELMGLTAEHELALAQQFTRLGVTR